MKILVDGFGGDNAPLECIKGCRMAADELGVQVGLAGQVETLKKVAADNGVSLEGIQLVQASQVIPVEEHAAEITKSYQDSSMAVGLKALAAGEWDAFVSAGSTGALVVGSSLLVKRIRGVKRAALASIIPTTSGCYMLMDCGANADCRPEMLVQFGIMGSAYMEKVMGIPTPRVAIVNIGAEATKGTELQVQAYQQFQNAPVNFAGNVEARDLPLGGCDVAVSDGFTGNVVLKLTEGMGSGFGRELKGIFMRGTLSKLAALAVKKGIRDFKRKMDYTEYGGAPLLGIARPVIKAHGSSNAKAFKNAVRQAKSCVEQGVIPTIQQSLAVLKVKEKEAQADAPGEPSQTAQPAEQAGQAQQIEQTTAHRAGKGEA